MYALAHIKKFVVENQERIGNQAEAILSRAEKESSNGMVSGDSVEEIFGDRGLATDFHQAFQNDPAYRKIGE